MNLKQALLYIHFPPDEQSLAKARFRLKFDEFFILQLKLLQLKKVRIEKSTGFIFGTVGHAFNTFFKEQLPFTLTGAQKKVIKEIKPVRFLLRL